MITSLLRGFIILELLAENGPLTFEKIAEFTRIPRTSVFRLLKTLETSGYVERKCSRLRMYEWCLGLRLLTLAGSKISQMDIRFEVRDIVEDLARVTGEFVQLGVLYNDKVLFLDVVRGPKTLASYAHVGTTLPINICAAGLVLGAALPEEDLERILRKQTLPKNTPKTLTDPTEIRRLLTEVAQKGYSIDDEYYALGHRCIGAPVLNHDGQVVAAINISGSTSSITEEKMPALIKQVIDHAFGASKRMGYVPKGN